jgi:two-component system CheB/CheR fusion protein
VVTGDRFGAGGPGRHDVTDLAQLRLELGASRRELAETREELRSAVEELQTTNEELQSTNQELETMNEQLQSANQELEAMNDELRRRTVELDDVDAVLESILLTIGLAVAVLDRRQRIRLWSSEARDLWGVTAYDVEGRQLLGLDIGLPVAQLEPLLLACLQGVPARQEMTLDAVDRRGRQIRCHVRCSPLSTSDGHVSGVVVTMAPPAT